MARKGSKPGERRGGRKAGTPNKASQTARAKASDPIYALAAERMRQIIEGSLPCQTCHGKGKTKYQAKAKDGKKSGRFFLRCCLSCYGEGLEKLSPDLIAKVAMALRREVVPELRAIDVKVEVPDSITYAGLLGIIDRIESKRPKE